MIDIIVATIKSIDGVALDVLASLCRTCWCHIIAYDKILLANMYVVLHIDVNVLALNMLVFHLPRCKHCSVRYGD